MNKITTSTAVPTRALKLEALSNIVASFESFCLASGLEALREMMDHDAQAICGPRHARGRERQAHRWGKTNGKIAFRARTASEACTRVAHSGQRRSRGSLDFH
jgi:putative transposase